MGERERDEVIMEVWVSVAVLPRMGQNLVMESQERDTALYGLTRLGTQPHHLQQRQKFKILKCCKIVL